MASFNNPQKAGDEWGAELYLKHDLGENPTMAEIQPTAELLLINPLTALEGAELVLGRRVDAAEDDVTQIVVDSNLSGDEKFALLLLYRA